MCSELGALKQAFGFILLGNSGVLTDCGPGTGAVITRTSAPCVVSCALLLKVYAAWRVQSMSRRNRLGYQHLKQVIPGFPLLRYIAQSYPSRD